MSHNVLFSLYEIAEAEYPQLCKLCSNQTACEYEHGFDPDINGPVSSHISAMHCLKNQGEVAYVSLQEAKRFFATVSNEFFIQSIADMKYSSLEYISFRYLKP